MTGYLHPILAAALMLGAAAASASDKVHALSPSSDGDEERAFSHVPLLIAEPETWADVVVSPGTDPATKSQRADGTVIVHLNGAGMEEVRATRTADGRLIPSCGAPGDGADPLPMTDFRVTRIARGARHGSP